MIKNGIEIDCSIFPARRAHGGFSNYGYAEPSIVSLDTGSIKEFPINTFNFIGRQIIFSGGGYFRLLPLFIIRHLMSQSKYNMTYFHPRDFDPGQPMINDLSLLRKFKSYYGIKNSMKKLEKLIENFDFIDLKTANNSIDWANVKQIKL